MAGEVVPPSNPFTGPASPWRSVCARGRSNRGVVGDARHAVEVGVVAGEIRDAVGLHDGNQKGVVAEKAGRLTDSRRRQNERRGDGENLDVIGGPHRRLLGSA